MLTGISFNSLVCRIVRFLLLSKFKEYLKGSALFMVKPDVSVKFSKKQSFLSAKTKFLNTRLFSLVKSVISKLVLLFCICKDFMLEF